MALTGLKQASELAGKNQSTIHRAMKSGRLSFTINESGERMIDTAELNRVFPIAVQDNDARKDASEGQKNPAQVAGLRAQLEAAAVRAALLQERLVEKDAILADLREDRDRWRVQAEKATLILTDQRQQSPGPREKEMQRRAWWRWGKG